MAARGLRTSSLMALDSCILFSILEKCDSPLEATVALAGTCKELWKLCDEQLWPRHCEEAIRTRFMPGDKISRLIHWQEHGGRELVTLLSFCPGITVWCESLMRGHPDAPEEATRAGYGELERIERFPLHATRAGCWPLLTDRKYTTQSHSCLLPQPGGHKLHFDTPSFFFDRVPSLFKLVDDRNQGLSFLSLFCNEHTSRERGGHEYSVFRGFLDQPALSM